MATKYVNSGAAGTASGDSWTDAYTTLGAAITAGADLIKVHNAHSEAIASDAAATYTLTVDTRIVCVNKDSSDALSTGAIVGNQTTNFAITFAGAFEWYVYGVSFRNGSNTTTGKNIVFSADAQYDFEACELRLAGGASSRIVLGATSGTTPNVAIRMTDCTLRFGATNLGINPGAALVEMYGCDVDSAGSAPATLWRPSGSLVCDILMSGCDLSHVTGTLVGDNGGSSATGRYVFQNCDFGSGVTIKAAATTVLNKGNNSVWAYDCDAGNVHYGLYHGDAFGETRAIGETGAAGEYYISDAPTIDGVEFSWSIVTTANCSFYNPYVSPWFYRAHDGTSAITLSVEGLNTAGTTVLKNDVVWAEFSYKGAANSVLTTIVNDRQDVGDRANGTTGGNQTSTKAYTDWNDATSSHSTFKLQTTGTVTPAEPGVLGARVFVGGASTTVYIDPQIRVA